MHNITMNTFEDINRNPKNWVAGVGINTEIGSLTYKLMSSSIKEEKLTSDPTYNADKILIQNPLSQTKEPDGRFKQREVASSNPIAVKGFGRASVVLSAISTITQFAKNRLNADDYDKVQNHSAILQMAAFDVNQALIEGKISPKLSTPEMLSDITNYVLSGVSNMKNKEVVETGKMIFNEFSKRRQPYDGTLRITGPSGQVILERLKPNPNYDPNYGKENKAPTGSN
jgi:hypothetical protein